MWSSFYDIHIFCEGIVSGLADVCVFIFSPYLSCKLRITVATAALILSAWYSKVIPVVTSYTASFMYLWRKESRGARSDDSHAIPLLYKLATYEVHQFMLEMWMLSVFLEQISLGPLYANRNMFSEEKRHEIFLCGQSTKQAHLGTVMFISFMRIVAPPHILRLC